MRVLEKFKAYSLSSQFHFTTSWACYLPGFTIFFVVRNLSLFCRFVSVCFANFVLADVAVSFQLCLSYYSYIFIFLFLGSCSYLVAVRSGVRTFSISTRVGERDERSIGNTTARSGQLRFSEMFGTVRQRDCAGIIIKNCRRNGRARWEAGLGLPCLAHSIELV